MLNQEWTFNLNDFMFCFTVLLLMMLFPIVANGFPTWVTTAQPPAERDNSQQCTSQNVPSITDKPVLSKSMVTDWHKLKMYIIRFYYKVNQSVYCLSLCSPAWSLSRDVGCRGTWSHPLQRLQHPLPLMERPGPQEREGQTGLSETVLWGGLARYGERERSCWGDVYIKSLQEGQKYTSEN